MGRVLSRSDVRLAAFGLAGLGLLSVGFVAFGADKPDAKADAPKYKIEDVMKKAYKGKTSLVARLSQGQGTKDDAAQLLEFNRALAANKPEKGDQADWDKRTAALLKASQALAGGDRTAPAALKAAADCKGCHTLHKPE